MSPKRAVVILPALSSAIALGAALLGAACGSAYGADVPAAPVGSDAGDAATAADAAIETDAIADASDGDRDGDAADAAPLPPFCVQHASDPGFVYCNDFETPSETVAPFGFTDTITPSLDGGSIASTSDVDRPTVLEIAAGATGTTVDTVSLREALGTMLTVPAFRIDLDVEVVAADVGYMTLADLHLTGSNCEASFGLGLFDGTQLGGTRIRDGNPHPIVLGAWQHVSFYLTPDKVSSTGFFELLYYGGTLLEQVEAHSAMNMGLTGCTTADLRIGVVEPGAGTKAVVRFDNVLVRVPQP